MERSRTRPTILLVEDYADSLDMLRRLLESLNYAVLPASNGKQALNIAANQDLDLVLTDFHLPDMTGATLVKRLRQLNQNLMHIPVVMVTAFDEYDCRELAREVGCNAFLSKPLDLDLLVETIDDAWNSSNEAGTVRQAHADSRHGSTNVNVDPLPTSL